MNHEEVMQELQEKLLDLNEQTQSIQAKADAENRDLLEDEEAQMKALFEEFEATEKEIERRERINAQTTKLRESSGPKAERQEIQPQNRPHDNPPQGPRERQPRIELMEDKGKWGWKSMGEFAAAVKVATRHPGNMDPRLVHNAPTTYSQEGVGPDGGFLVPPDFRQMIMEKVMGEESLLSRTDQMVTSSNHITFPKDETTPWQSSGGIQAYWDGENDQLTQSKVQLKEETLKLNKLTALIPVTEELQDDAPSLDAYLRRKVPEKFDWKLQDAIINGSGVGKPKGIMNADCLVTVAKDTSTSPVQAASTVRFKNIVDMYSRMYGPLRSRAVWLINQNIEGQLYQMAFDPTATSKVPVYLPAGSVAGSPYGTLMGRPVIPVQGCQALGTTGDIIFADLGSYMTVTKTGGIRSDVSIHLWFDYDTMAYRFIMRIGGQPWWSSAITPANDTSPTSALSCFVSLATRS